MTVGHYLLGFICLVSATGMTCIIIDILFTKEQEAYLPANMSKKQTEAYFDEDDSFEEDEPIEPKEEEAEVIFNDDLVIGNDLEIDFDSEL